jgi:hypothetical protein
MNVGSGVITQVIINLGTRCEWVVRFTPRLFYSRMRAPCCTLKRRLGAHQSRSEHRREEGAAFLPPPPFQSRSWCPFVAKHRWYLTAWARWSWVQYTARVWLYVHTFVRCVGRGLRARLTARVSLATCVQYLNLTSLNLRINPLQTKRRLLYLKTQSVPRCKHFSSRL